MTETKSNLLDLDGLGPFHFNLGAGAFNGGGGGIPEGLYDAKLVDLKWVQNKDGTRNLSPTLAFNGYERTVFDYVSLPHPGHEYAEVKDLEFNTFLLAFGAFPEDAKNEGDANGAALKALIGRTAKVYYIPQEQDTNGKFIKESRHEVTYLPPTRAARVAAGDVKITRRRKATPVNTLTAGAATTATTQPGFGAAQPATTGFGGATTGFGAQQTGGPVPQPSAGPSLGGLFGNNG